MLPRMTEAEIALLRRELSKAECIIEFGIGGSTVLAVEAGCREIWSVETDEAWMQMARDAPEIRPALEDGRIRLLHADIGEVGDWGMPVDETFRAAWLQYPLTAWTEVAPETVGMVLVDGRFRVASALTSALLGRSGLRILVHDLTTRPRYKPLYEYLAEVERVDSLGVFTRKPETADAGLLAAINRYITDYK